MYPGSLNSIYLTRPTEMCFSLFYGKIFLEVGDLRRLYFQIMKQHYISAVAGVTLFHQLSDQRGARRHDLRILSVPTRATPSGKSLRCGVRIGLGTHF